MKILAKQYRNNYHAGAYTDRLRYQLSISVSICDLDVLVNLDDDKVNLGFFRKLKHIHFLEIASDNLIEPGNE